MDGGPAKTEKPRLTFMGRAAPMQTSHTCLDLLDTDENPLADGKMPSIPRLRYLRQLRPRPV